MDEVHIIDIRTLLESRPGKEHVTIRPGDLIYIPRKGDRIGGGAILSAIVAALTRVKL